jgi:hypothetical protein
MSFMSNPALLAFAPIAESKLSMSTFARLGQAQFPVSSLIKELHT